MLYYLGILTKNTSLRARSDSPHRRKSEAQLRIEQQQIQESQFSHSSTSRTTTTEQRTLVSSVNQIQVSSNFVKLG